jgi:sulfur-carrier protein adenylyltransferase/sulfurtransferase
MRAAKRPSAGSGVSHRNIGPGALGIVLAGMPQNKPFTPDQVARYARHLILPEVGGAGQRKLLGSSVLLLGAGGLGSPAAMYLAAAGVGKIGIVDFDVVDASNLQRQLLHGHDDIGRPKVESAAETLRSLNPDVEVVPINEHLNSETAMRIFAPFDVIIDGTDNFPTRYLANDAAHFLAKPLVHGSIFRFEGRLALFDSAKGTGCYRCLFPEPPPPGSVQSCAEAGVFGVLPGIIGSMMAFETIKYLLDIGRPMIGRYLLFEGEDMTFRELRLKQNKACPLCGENPTVDSLIDYEAWCGTPAMEPSEAKAS